MILHKVSKKVVLKLRKINVCSLFVSVCICDCDTTTEASTSDTIDGTIPQMKLQILQQHQILSMVLPQLKLQIL